MTKNVVPGRDLPASFLVPSSSLAVLRAVYHHSLSMELMTLAHSTHLEMTNTSSQALWFPFFSHELEIGGN